MTAEGKAILAMFNGISHDTYYRACEWFKVNPCHPPYCYWARDEFISVEHRHDTDTLARHPEIDDIDDHTIVSIHDDVLYLTEFCPRLRTGIKAMIDGGVCEGNQENIFWRAKPYGDNYIVACWPE